MLLTACEIMYRGRSLLACPPPRKCLRFAHDPATPHVGRVIGLYSPDQLGVPHPGHGATNDYELRSEWSVGTLVKGNGRKIMMPVMVKWMSYRSHGALNASHLMLVRTSHLARGTLLAQPVQSSACSPENSTCG